MHHSQMTDARASHLHRTPSILALAWRQTWRDLRAGELRLLGLAVVLAVAALSAVSFFADRLNAGLARDAGQLLGGDVAVAADQPPPGEWEAWAKAAGLRTARTAGFPSMARAEASRGGEFRLVSVKAVSAAYPLRGVLQVRQASGAEAEVRSGPPAGAVWADASLLEALNLSIGDALLLGDAKLTIDRAIVNEPDRGAGFMSFSPRVMLNESDLAATGLIQPARR